MKDVANGQEIFDPRSDEGVAVAVAAAGNRRRVGGPALRDVGPEAEPGGRVRVRARSHNSGPGQVRIRLPRDLHQLAGLLR